MTPCLFQANTSEKSVSATAHLTVINHRWTCRRTVRSLRKYLLCHDRLCDAHASVSASHSALWNFKQRAKQLWPSRWDSICTDTDSPAATAVTVNCSRWKIISTTGCRVCVCFHTNWITRNYFLPASLWMFAPYPYLYKWNLTFRSAADPSLDTNCCVIAKQQKGKVRGCF